MIGDEGALEIRRLWRHCGVPERHRTMAEVVTAPSDKLSGWHLRRDDITDRLGSGMITVLAGPRGTGKTQLAACLIRDACVSQVKSLYTTAMGFFLAVRASYDTVAASEKHVVEKFIKPDLLVIDEIHERGNTPWEDRLLAHVIDQRYAMMRDTILVTNETSAAAARSLGASITDRVRECGWFVECDWPSFRS